MSMNLIEAAHLHKAFGSVVAVHDLKLSVSAGEIYGLVGPDGSGKTTTLRMLCGAYQPTPDPEIPAPTIQINGIDMIHQVEQARACLGYLPQRFSLYEELTVMENLRFFAEVRGLPTAEWRPRCMEILSFVGLDEFTNRRAGHLSGGMKQKLGLAAALVHRPHVLLLDEPTTGVDPVTRQDFWQLIIRLVAQGNNGNGETAVLVSTPYMDEAARCTVVGFMSKGQLVTEGTPGELCTRLHGRILELAGQPLQALRQLIEAGEAGIKENIDGIQMFGDRLHLRVAEGKADEVSVRLMERIPQQEVQISLLRQIEPQLEDVFMALLEVEP
jgi:ABC-2 type transport system ATP-binding protein